MEGDKYRGETWTLPEAGWIKVNTDAAYNLGRDAMGFIVRDRKDKVLSMASKVVESTTAKLAELSTIEWATKIAVFKEWENVIWSLDALEVIRDINSSADSS